MSPKWFKRIAAGAGALIVLALIAVALRPAPVAVDLAAVARGSLLVTIDDEGETRVRDVYVVSAPVAGRVLRIEQEVGDAVEAGQTILARIQPSDPSFLDVRSQSEAEARVRAAQAELALHEADVQRAIAERDFADVELERTRELIKGGNVSEAALDRKQMSFNTAAAQVKTADAAVAVARSELERARASLIAPSSRDGEGVDPRCCIVNVRAPVSGRVLKLIQESETVVGAGQGLVEVGDPADLEIVVDLLSTDAVRVREGAAVAVTDWGGGRTLKGRVRRVEPFGFTKISALGVEEQRVNVIIDFTEPREAWASLGHGYRVEVRIEEWRGDQVLKVPTSALFRQRNDWAVFVADSGDRARLKTVQVGRANGREAQIVAGLEPGERVVLHPGETIDDGVRLTERPAA